MKRGEIWTVAGAKDYGASLAPAVILQDDRFLMPRPRSPSVHSQQIRLMHLCSD